MNFKKLTMEEKKNHIIDKGILKISELKDKIIITIKSKSLFDEVWRYLTIEKELSITIEDNKQSMTNYYQIYFQDSLMNDFLEVKESLIKYVDSLDLDELKELDDKDKIPKQFFKENLLEEIFKELDKKHKRDDKEKLALFIIRVSAELRNPSDRVSVALKGESSSGKDNAIKTVFELFPEIDSFLLTRGTQSALEERAREVKAIAFSEINANRENGANKELTEFFKQLSEGGCRVIKRDKKTNEVLDIISEQKSLFYGTTETETDEELQTRYIIIPIRSNKEKNRIVINDCLDNVSTIENLLQKINKTSWVSKGIKNLEHNIEVIIPFATKLKEQIKDEDGKSKYLFDETKDRVKRDIKRILSLTKAVTWIHQKQRRIQVVNGIKFVYAEPSDFLATIEIFAEFFNLTYTGLDHRIQTCLEKIKELEGKHDGEILSLGYGSKYSGWVIRHILADELGISSVKTIKKRIDDLREHQFIETFYDRSINPKGYLVRTAGWHQASNRLSLAVSLPAITSLLLAYLTPKIQQEIYKNKQIKPLSLNFLSKTPLDPIFSEKLPPSKLPPVICPERYGESFTINNLLPDFEYDSELCSKWLKEAKEKRFISEIKPDVFKDTRGLIK